MENKKLNEKESLELISQMIQNTRTRVEKDGGTPFLIWGYGTVIISLLVWYMVASTGKYEWQYLWFLLPAIGFPGTLWVTRKNESPVKTYRSGCKLYLDCIWECWFFGIMCFYCLSSSYFVYYSFAYGNGSDIDWNGDTL